MFYMKRESSNRKPSAKVKPPAKKAVLNNAAKAVKSVEKKKKPIVSIRKIDVKIKKIKPSASENIVKRKTQRLESVVLNKKTKLAEVKKRLASDKSKKKLVKPVVSAKAKSAKPQSSISAEKTKSAVKKAAPRISADKAKIKFVKPKTTVSIKKIQPSVSVKKSKSAKIPSSVAVNLAKSKIVKKSKATVSPKSGNGKIARLVKNKIQNSKLSPTTKTKSLKSVSSIKAVKPIEKQGSPKNIKLTDKAGRTPVIKANENRIEPMKLPLSAKSKPKKAKPISSAVFRGKKDRYDFNVFALDETFEAVPAVYIISKRKTDRLKKGHHALICIGETDSICDEIKRHRKGKCVKKHDANVISILPETNEKKRLKIETDLKAAHAVVCNLE
jgi:hypothetical protein